MKRFIKLAIRFSQFLLAVAERIRQRAIDAELARQFKAMEDREKAIQATLDMEQAEARRHAAEQRRLREKALQANVQCDEKCHKSCDKIKELELI